MCQLLYEVWVPYCVTALSCSIGPGAVQAACEGIGRPGDAIKLMAAVGDVESASASFTMWDLSRMVRNSAELETAFDCGVVGLLCSVAASVGLPMIENLCLSYRDSAISIGRKLD